MTRRTSAPDRRLWPRPLGYHLMLGSATWTTAAATLPAFLSGLPVIHDSLAGESAALRAKAATLDSAELARAVLAEAQNRVARLIQGIAAYQAHPYHRSLPRPRAAAAFGTSRLLTYGGRKPAPGVMLVPSLINPSYILDLAADHSLMRYLATRRLRPALLDWGTPGPEEQEFTLTDYITRRLEPALEAMAARTGGPVHLAGYCMGGNLALALATRRPDLVRSLLLLATPWDFHATSVTLIRALSLMLTGVLAHMPAHQPVPVDLIQLFFASLDPTLTDRKFRRFAGRDPESAAARDFVAIEDWANDGMSLARAVAAECLYGWYGNNTPHKGLWRVAGTAVDPGVLACPVLIVAPRADRIVPPAAALALADHIPHADILQAGSGHVAMIAGRAAATDLWPALADWLHNR